MEADYEIFIFAGSHLPLIATSSPVHRNNNRRRIKEHKKMQLGDVRGRILALVGYIHTLQDK